ncbi:unnamed protein product, partial [Discosporangium mesarthrocarpum]
EGEDAEEDEEEEEEEEDEEEEMNRDEGMNTLRANHMDVGREREGCPEPSKVDTNPSPVWAHTLGPAPSKRRAPLSSIAGPQGSRAGGINTSTSTTTAMAATVAAVDGIVATSAGAPQPGPSGKILWTVGRAVRAVKQGNEAVAVRRERYTPGGKDGPGVDERSAGASATVQATVGALAEAALGLFEDHMADPALHRYLSGGGAGKQRGGYPTPTDLASSLAVRGTLPGSSGDRGGGGDEGLSGMPPPPHPPPLTTVVPLIDSSAGYHLTDAAGLSVELLDDLSWLFASLEPASGGGARSPLSAALSCWACGRVLAALPQRSQLQAALGPPLAPTGCNWHPTLGGLSGV